MAFRHEISLKISIRQFDHGWRLDMVKQIAGYEAITGSADRFLHLSIMMSFWEKYGLERYLF